MKKSFLLYITLIVGLLCSCEDDDNERLEALFSSNKQSAVAGEVISFKDESRGNPVRWNWYFEGGTPAASELFSPEVSYSQPGTYSVKLVVGRGNDSISVVKESYITIDYPSAITADFTLDKNTGTDDEFITFTDQSTGFPTSWAWEFIPLSGGSSITSSEQNPSLKFEPDIYTVKLTVTNPKATDTKTLENVLTIIDRYAVAADFTSSTRNTYAGGTVTFEDASVGLATSWAWTFEGGSPASSTSQSPTVTYTNAGKYKVKLVASNQENTSTTEKEGYIVVIPNQDLIMYFPFNGNGNDFGPNGLHTQIASAGGYTVNFTDSLSRKDGMKAAGFYSDNNTKYGILRVPDNALLDIKSSDFTVSFWARTYVSATQGVYHHGAAPGAVNANRQTWFRYQGSSPYARFIIEYTGQSGNWTDYTTKNLADGTWHHFVGVHKAGSTYLYVDGVEAAKSENKAIKAIEPSPYLIGGMYRITGGEMQYESFLKGSVSEFILYKRALTAAEAQSLYADY